MSHSYHSRPRSRGLPSGDRYRTPAGQPSGTPFVADVEAGLPDAQHPAIRAGRDSASMKDHHSKAIGRSKHKRWDARAERRKDKVNVREVALRGEADAGPVQPHKTYRKGPRHSEAR